VTLTGPELRGETWCWSESAGEAGEIEVRFTGRGPGGEREEVLRRIEAETGEALPVAWLKQIHSDVALLASPGRCGEGDGLYSREPGLALAVVTADCVPVLVATEDGRIAAIHAGWRGLASGVIGATLRSLEESGEGRGEGARAWIGPAIGPCCYEVGEEVAEAVIAASGPEVAAPGPHGKPHLDLVRAARIQLARAGFEGDSVSSIPFCTRCETGRLWSYRREGKGAGRNIAFIWRRADPGER
jgi:YfiH family protein